MKERDRGRLWGRGTGRRWCGMMGQRGIVRQERQ